MRRNGQVNFGSGRIFEREWSTELLLAHRYVADESYRTASRDGVSVANYRQAAAGS